MCHNQAYQAYRTERLNGTDEPRLPGFETFNTGKKDQLFRIFLKNSIFLIKKKNYFFN